MDRVSGVECEGTLLGSRSKVSSLRFNVFLADILSFPKVVIRVQWKYMSAKHVFDTITLKSANGEQLGEVSSKIELITSKSSFAQKYLPMSWLSKDSGVGSIEEIEAP